MPRLVAILLLSRSLLDSLHQNGSSDRVVVKVGKEMQNCRLYATDLHYLIISN